jgi:hypothetical protein
LFFYKESTTEYEKHQCAWTTNDCVYNLVVSYFTQEFNSQRFTAAAQ